MTLSLKDKGPTPYQNSKALEELMTQMIEVVTELEPCQHFKIGVMYTDKKMTRGGMPIAAKCSKVSGPVRFKTGVDFTIVVAQKEFFASTREEQGRVMIHELSHVTISPRSVGRDLLPGIRPHEGDFCELPEHDAYSKGIYERYAKMLTAGKKIPLQETIDQS